MISTNIVKIDSADLLRDTVKKAVEIIKKGGLVIIPTETVYGIAADILNRKAIDRLCKIKKRPKEKPFSVIIDNKDKIEDFASDIPVAAHKLISHFWPGPLTLVLKAKSGNDTIGLRMPDNDIALRIIRAYPGTIACPSANFSGTSPAVNFEAAIQDFSGLVEMAIDNGPCRLGLESTVLDLTSGAVKVLREIAIKKQDIDAVIKKKNILFVCTGNSCRSVMAKGLLQKRLKEAGRTDVEVLSAGIAIISGYRATQETINLMSKEGIDVSDHYTRRVSQEMIKKSDIILVMEKMHEARIIELVPQAKNRVFLLKEFAKIEETNLDIEDPIGQSIQEYSRILYILKQAVDRIIEIV